MTHTPGPWTVQGLESQEVQAKERRLRIALICHPSHGPSVESQANARLIAAAPDAINALHLASHALRLLSEQGGDIPFWNVGGGGYAASVAVREAIAKAEDRP